MYSAPCPKSSSRDTSAWARLSSSPRARIGSPAEYIAPAIDGAYKATAMRLKPLLGDRWFDAPPPRWDSPRMGLVLPTGGRIAGRVLVVILAPPLRCFSVALRGILRPESHSPSGWRQRASAPRETSVRQASEPDDNIRGGATVRRRHGRRVLPRHCDGASCAVARGESARSTLLRDGHRPPHSPSTSVARGSASGERSRSPPASISRTIELAEITQLPCPSGVFRTIVGWFRTSLAGTGISRFCCLRM